MQVRFAFLAGLAVVLLLIPLNRWLATRIEAARCNTTYNHAVPACITITVNSICPYSTHFNKISSVPLFILVFTLNV